MTLPPPVCWIIGGANGAGKSSIVEISPRLRDIGMIVNADLVARSIAPDHPESVSQLAGRRVIAQLNQLMSERKGFVYETTLSSHQSIAVMSAARTAGYRIGLLFVVLEDVNLNVLRVEQRVARGGHDIPEHVIRRRYRRAIANLSQATSIAHETIVYDNSGQVPVELIAIADGQILQNALRNIQKPHRDVADAIARALDVPASPLLHGAS